VRTDYGTVSTLKQGIEPITFERRGLAIRPASNGFRNFLSLVFDRQRSYSRIEPGTRFEDDLLQGNPSSRHRPLYRRCSEAIMLKLEDPVLVIKGAWIRAGAKGVILGSIVFIIGAGGSWVKAQVWLAIICMGPSFWHNSFTRFD
jgi:hypothetical protein